MNKSEPILATKQPLIAELILKTSDQRYYKVNQKLQVAPLMFGRKNAYIQDDLNKYKDTWKKEYLHLFPTDGIEIICISDAHTHTERIVFAAVLLDNGKPARLHTQLDGYNTMSIHGGDPDAIYPDYVYLRRIARANGFSFHIENFVTPCS